MNYPVQMSMVLRLRDLTLNVFLVTKDYKLYSQLTGLCCLDIKDSPKQFMVQDSQALLK